MDITSLYTVIPNNEGLQALKYFFNQRPMKKPSSETLLRHLLHNLHAMQKNLHRRNREETGEPLPRAPTRRRTKKHRCVQTSRAPFQSSEPLPPQHDYLRAILTPREHRKLQKSRTKINFSTGYTLSTPNQ